MLEFNELLKLAKTVAHAKPSASVAYSFGDTTYGYAELNETLRSEFKALAPDYRTYKINQNTIFALIEQTIEDVLPQKVLEQYGQFADVKTFAQGDKPIFRQKTTVASRRRAKQFIGKVGLAGLYETFRLDGKSYEVTTNAIGGAAQCGFEEFLDGNFDFAEILDVLMEGLDECIYVEIEKQLIGAVNSIIPANFQAAANFDETAFDRLIQIADSYAHSTIYCTYEFAAKMWPSANMMSNEMKNEAFTGKGYVSTYKNGHQVVVLPQSFEDETNARRVIDPSYVWIIPTGAEKPVKIAFEGGTIMDEYTNYDRSRDIQVYKKVGVRAVFSNAICVYRDTALAAAFASEWGSGSAFGRVAD